MRLGPSSNKPVVMQVSDRVETHFYMHAPRFDTAVKTAEARMRLMAPNPLANVLVKGL